MSVLAEVMEPEGPGVFHPSQPGWADLVFRIQQDDQAAIEKLYRVFSGGMRYYLCRQLGSQDLDDKVHDCFLIVVQAIRRGDLREPGCLMGFARTVVRRQIASHIDVAIQQRNQRVDIDIAPRVADAALNPEEAALMREREKLAASILTGIPRRDREVLTRFYLREQAEEQICADMNLTETQFRLLKSRAKARFGKLGRRKLLQRNVPVLYEQAPR